MIGRIGTAIAVCLLHLGVVAAAVGSGCRSSSPPCSAAIIIVIIFAVGFNKIASKRGLLSHSCRLVGCPAIIIIIVTIIIIILGTIAIIISGIAITFSAVPCYAVVIVIVVIVVVVVAAAAAAIVKGGRGITSPLFAAVLQWFG